MAEKLCVFCTHLEFQQNGYGDYPDPANLSCYKGHIKDGDICGVDDFRAVIVQAENCPDYDQVKT